MDELKEIRELWERPEPPTAASTSAARAALLNRIAAARAESAAGEPVVAATVATGPVATGPVATGAGTTATGPTGAVTPATGTTGRRTPRRAFTAVLRAPRLRWLLPAAGLAAAVAVAAATIPGAAPDRPAATGPRAGAGQPAASGTGSHAEQPATANPGQRILLAAAVTAEAQPEGTGTYWHVKESITQPGGGPAQTQQTWTGHDGSQWLLAGDVRGVGQTVGAVGFSLGPSTLTLDELRALPANPEALKARIAELYRHPRLAMDPAARPPVPDIPESQMPASIAGTLSHLLYAVPSTPQVRAGALRALASMPDITDLGAVPGGRALRLSFAPPPAGKFPGGKIPAGAGQVTFVIDTATARMVSITNYQHTTTVLAAGWTDQRPPEVQFPGKEPTTR